MEVLSFIILFSSAFFGQSSGVCLDWHTTVGLCTAGSSLLEKLLKAEETCTLDGVHQISAETLRSNMFYCADFNDIRKSFETFYALQECRLRTLGWKNETDMMSDIATLPLAVQKSINYREAMDECYVNTVTLTKEVIDQLRAECVDTYSEEELAMIESMMISIEYFRCFWSMFSEACGNYITQEYLPALIESAKATVTGNRDGEEEIFQKFSLLNFWNDLWNVNNTIG